MTRRPVKPRRKPVRWMIVGNSHYASVGKPALVEMCVFPGKRHAYFFHVYRVGETVPAIEGERGSLDAAKRWARCYADDLAATQAGAADGGKASG